MPPGIDLDIELARTLWRVFVIRDSEDGDYLVSETGEHIPVPRFSRDVTDANKVVAFMKEQGYVFQTRLDAAQGLYHVCFLKADGRKYQMTTSSTLAHAISLAALAAVKRLNVVLYK